MKRKRISIKIPVNFPTRIKQLFCTHDAAVGKTAISKGADSKEVYNYVVYECGRCGLCITSWEKEEDW